MWLKNCENFVNFEQRGSADSRVLNWEFFMSGLKCCFDQIKMFLNDQKLLYGFNLARKHNEIDEFLERCKVMLTLEREKVKGQGKMRKKTYEQ